MARHAQITQNNKIAILHNSLQYLKKKLEIKLIFCMQINIKVFYKLISTLWASKFPTRRYYHYCWTWSEILSTLRVRVSNTFTISQKRSYEWSLFLTCRYTFGNFVFDGSAQILPTFYFYYFPHVQSNQNRKLVIFLQYILKVLQLLLCSIVMQNIQVFYGAPIVFIISFTVRL